MLKAPYGARDVYHRSSGYKIAVNNCNREQVIYVCHQHNAEAPKVKCPSQVRANKGKKSGVWTFSPLASLPWQLACTSQHAWRQSTTTFPRPVLADKPPKEQRAKIPLKQNSVQRYAAGERNSVCNLLAFIWKSWIAWGTEIREWVPLRLQNLELLIRVIAWLTSPTTLMCNSRDADYLLDWKLKKLHPSTRRRKPKLCWER